MDSHDTVADFLVELKDLADAFHLIYPDKTIQIQLRPITYEFIKVGLTAYGAVFEEEKEPKEDKPMLLFGYQLFLNKWLSGRYAIAILEEEEQR